MSVEVDREVDSPTPIPPSPSRRERVKTRRERKKAPRSRKYRLIRSGCIAAIAILVAVPAWSLGRVMLADNTDPLGVRVVEWARDHHLSGIVNRIENFWYTHNQPPRGGTPKGGIPNTPAPVASAVKHAPTAAAPTTPLQDKPPANIVPFPSTPLPGEGVVWPALKVSEEVENWTFWAVIEGPDGEDGPPEEPEAAAEPPPRSLAWVTRNRIASRGISRKRKQTKNASWYPITAACGPTPCTRVS